MSRVVDSKINCPGCVDKVRQGQTRLATEITKGQTSE